MFSKTESAQISDKYVAVRLLGGNDLDDEGKAFMARYGVGGYPTLLAMTADGAVLGREFQRTLDGILATMDGAATADTEFRTKEAKLGKSQLPEALREMAGLYKDRMQHDKARANYERLTAKNPAIDDQVGLLEVLTALGDTDARKTLLGTLVETHPEHESHIHWRIDLATADLPTKIASREQFMEMMNGKKAALETLCPTVEKARDQAIVRNELANVLFRLNEQTTALEHWDWILANAGESDLVPDALWGKAYLLINSGYVAKDLAKVKEARDLFQKIIDDHAGHAMASRASRVLGQADGLIQQLEDAAKQAEDAKKAAEEKKDGGETKEGDG